MIKLYPMLANLLSFFQNDIHLCHPALCDVTMTASFVNLMELIPAQDVSFTRSCKQENKTKKEKLLSCRFHVV